MSYTSYTPNYYSIDDILATQERVPCKFVQDVPNLGKLNPSVDEVNLKAGPTILELPMWLVLDAFLGSNPIVMPELPKIYKEAYREILKADPCAVDLSKLELYFYEFGAYSLKFDLNREIDEVLLNTFKSRFRLLMDLAYNSISDPSIQQKLDVLERNIFCAAYESCRKLNNWLVDSEAPIEIANMVLNHKKRKRVDIEDLLP